MQEVSLSNLGEWIDLEDGPLSGHRLPLRSIFRHICMSNSVMASVLFPLISPLPFFLLLVLLIKFEFASVLEVGGGGVCNIPITGFGILFHPPHCLAELKIFFHS